MAQKLNVLRRHNVMVTKKLVKDAVTKLDRVIDGAGGRQIAERGPTRTTLSELCLSGKVRRFE